ncbi:hypothetical protein GCM10010435_79270 [Winogradskya consettensis]|uniref:FAD dependent oxidoreductase domain-containing protein n=1 Tax=Winogradskya consettensis TaxID=113560 RepID=A0A919SU84_9ACTN|nr:hypothetical protein [Actinoplanes consettensis]GIM77507.1 hypothetical protein Aco04nite_55690 [Actinoplanes consettensis]
MAPRNRFAVAQPVRDRAMPGLPHVLVAAACSGHGLKFGPAIGAALADLATGIASPDPDGLSPIRTGSPPRLSR